VTTEQPKHLVTITAFFVAVLLISNIASVKIVDFGPLTFDGGTLLFPISYIFGDILTEVYGFRRTRKVVWLGFAASLLMALTLFAVGRLPATADWPYQQAFDEILGQTPRIVAASLMAYLAGEFCNAVILAKMKVAMQGKNLWMRTIGSTLVGQAVDTGVFVVAAFGGILEPNLLTQVIVSNYVFKCGIEILFTPGTYFVTGFLKRTEGIDVFDRETKFNPFRFG
jgi:hypothetical protein